MADDWRDAFSLWAKSPPIASEFDPKDLTRALARMKRLDPLPLPPVIYVPAWHPAVGYIQNPPSSDGWRIVEPHPEDEKLMEGTSFDAYREAVAQEGEMNRKKFMGQYDNPADEYALKAKSPVDSGPAEPISQWLRPKNG